MRLSKVVLMFVFVMILGVWGCGDSDRSVNENFEVDPGLGTVDISVNLTPVVMWTDTVDQVDDRTEMITQEIEYESITRVEVIVSGDGIDPDIVAPLSMKENVATGQVYGIPAGPDRLFVINAYIDGVEEPVCTGSNTAEIMKDEITYVTIMLQCNSESDEGTAIINGELNNPPHIDYVFVDAVAVDPARST